MVDSKAAGDARHFPLRYLEGAQRVCELLSALLFAASATWSAINSGGLWRDEASSANLVQLPSISAVWAHLKVDSFPASWIFFLRTATTLLHSATDGTLHMIGVLTAFALLGCFFLCARALHSHFPAATVTLLAVNPNFMRAIVENRAYGLGCVLLLLSIITIWRMVEQPSISRMAASTVICLLASNCIYPNFVCVLCFLAAAILVCFIQRKRRSAFSFCLIGLAVAASILIYRPMLEAQHDFSMLQYVSLTHKTVGDSLAVALNWKTGTTNTLLYPYDSLEGAVPRVISAIGWMAVLIGAGLENQGFLQPHAERDIDSASAVLTDYRVRIYLRLCLILSLSGLLLTIFVLGYSPFSWHWATFLALSVLLPLTTGKYRGISAVRSSVNVTVLALASVLIQTTMVTSATRQTNIDIIAHTVERMAGPQDLVIISPYYLSPTFYRYYHGTAPWITVPMLKERNFENAAEMKSAELSHEPLQDIESHIRYTLSRGGRVFFISTLPLYQIFVPGRVALLPPPSITGTYKSDPYVANWTAYTASFLWQHAYTVNAAEVKESQQVSFIERAYLFVFSPGPPLASSPTVRPG